MRLPYFNVSGAAIGTVIAYVIAATLDIIAVKKLTNVRFNIRMVMIKPLAATIGMSLFTVISYRVLLFVIPMKIALLVAIGMSAAVYLVLLFALKALSLDDLEDLPKGDKIEKLLCKIIK